MWEAGESWAEEEEVEAAVPVASSVKVEPKADSHPESPRQTQPASTKLFLVSSPVKRIPVRIFRQLAVPFANREVVIGHGVQSGRLQPRFASAPRSSQARPSLSEASAASLLLSLSRGGSARSPRKSLLKKPESKRSPAVLHPPPPQPSKTGPRAPLQVVRKRAEQAMPAPVPKPPAKRSRSRPARPPTVFDPQCDVVVWVERLTSLPRPPVGAKLHKPEWPADPLASRQESLARKRDYDWAQGLRESISMKTIRGKEAVGPAQVEDRRRHFLDAASQFVLFTLARDLRHMSPADRDAFLHFPLFAKVVDWWWPEELAAAEALSQAPKAPKTEPRPPFGGHFEAVTDDGGFFAKRRKNLTERAAYESYAEWSEDGGKKALGLRKTNAVHVLQAILNIHLLKASEETQEALLYHLYDFYATMLPAGQLKLGLPADGRLRYRRFRDSAKD